MSQNLNKNLKNLKNLQNFKGFNKNLTTIKKNLTTITEKEIQTISFINNLNQSFFLRTDPNPEYPMYTGELPIHIAIRKNYPNIIILTLLEKCPESARIKTKNQKLPLHYSFEFLGANNVLMKKYYEDFIIKLIDVYPDGVKELVNRESPLGLALKKKFSLKIISKLLEISPEQIKTKIFFLHPHKPTKTSLSFLSINN